MLKLAASALAGVMAFHRLPELPQPAWAVPMFILALLALRDYSARTWLLSFLAGFAWTWWVAADVMAQRMPAAWHGQDLVLEGYVASFVTANEHRLSFNFHPYRNRSSGDIPRRWRLSWYRPRHALQPGDNLRITVRARQARTLGNPAGFDYEGWLFRERLTGTGYVRSLTPIPGAPASLSQWWLKQRARLYQRLTRAAGERGKLLGALVVGARHEFTDRDWDVLRRTGTGHLVAISGLHVGLVAGAVFMVLQAFLIRLPWIAVSLRAADVASWLAILVAGTYCALAGFGVPAQRALLMLCVAAAAFGARRRLAWSDALACALLVVLAADPLAVLGVGFWLSFGAVAALLLALRPVGLASSGSGPGFWMAGLLRTQGVVTLALVPVLLAGFGELALFSPLVNLVAVPWFSIVLVPGTLLLALLHMLHADLAAGLTPWISGLMENSWRCLAWIADIPWATMTWPVRPMPLVAYAVFGILAFFLARGFPGRILFLATLLPLVGWRPTPLPTGSVRLTVLDVGQGLAALIETRNHVSLYDTGPASPGGFDAGASVVVPALQARGWRTLDRLVIGHGDQDHAGGRAAVLGVFPDASVILGPSVQGSGAVCRAGDSWVRDEIVFSFLHPEHGADSDNNSSCVLKVTGPGGSVLLTGDIEQAAEAQMVHRNVLVRSDVVVVPHHGSATSSTPGFVAAVRPRLAVIPAGFGNRWGMPDPGVVSRWQAVGASVFTTAEYGRISIVIGPAGIRLEALGRPTRYWHTL